MHRDPEPFARPIGRDVHIVVGVQTCVFDAVPDQLGNEHLGVLEDVGRDRERTESLSHLGQGSRTGSDVQVQTPLGFRHR